MSLLCLSLAATLRCAGIPKTESIVWIIPPAIEALVSLFLIRTVWRNGRRWLLVAEAWTFFLLVILDYISHAVVRGMWSVRVFEPMDKAIGVLSGVPILAYTSFLFLLTRSDILPLITPTVLRTIFQFSLFSLIPPTLMSHELGSLIGVSYRINMATLVPETGFLDPTTRSLSFAFTTSAVVCLASFQLLIFLVCTWRISQAWDRASQPIFESVARGRSNSTSTSYLGDEPGIRGLSWLALALALGATETLLSLGTQTFVLVLIRRILRVFARGSLMYALVRGSSDGFSHLEDGRQGGVRGLISNPRLSTFAQLTPRATAFYNQRNPFADPSTPRSRVTVHYDQKSAPVLQMRFSGLDVPDSSQFRTRSGSTLTSMAAHAGHSAGALSRSRTLSEKRGAALAAIQIPSAAVLSGVVATQSASSTRSSSLPAVSLPPSQSRLALGGLNRSSSSQLDRSNLAHLNPSSSSHLNRSSSSHLNRSTSRTSGQSEEPAYGRNASLEGVRELASQFPVIPPRAVFRHGPTQLAYAVEEEEDERSQRNSNGSSRSRPVRTNTADSNVSALSTSTSMSRRKPVPAHTPGGTIIDLPSTNRPAESNSGERVVVETHSTLFPQSREYYDYTSSRASSDETDLTLSASPSPAEILTRRPVQLAERAAQLERQQRLSGGDEHSWMMRSSVPMSQSVVVSRTPEVMDSADFESSRVELEGVASPKSAWSAQSPWPSRSRRSTLRPGSTMGLNLNRPGSNVEGWGRKLSDADPSRVPPNLRALTPEGGREQEEYIRKSLLSTRTRHESGSFVGDAPHAM
ncbi:hypothetical protein OPQ81_003724 [Rhizoctonia solani]|nr:hypothetical protein OPQ81_003724 [Rhizoctonia solani]